MDEERKVAEGIHLMFPGDQRVCALLGRQRPPAADARLRLSRFVYTDYVEGQYALYHTLTRQGILLDARFVDYTLPGKRFPASCLSAPEAAILYDSHFLVPENAREAETYFELRDIMVLKEERPAGMTSFTILPTTVCNARCFYCFEQGMRYHPMAPDTADATAAFIRQQKPAEGKVHLHWFGGEPLCAVGIIDRITKGLKDAGVEFTAEMTSNGSLFTPELVKKAKEDWQLSSIQITLDGMAEEYARRKQYVAGIDAPFDRVIRNLHLLTEAGIRVSVRLNLDMDNAGELYRVVDYLAENFTGESRKYLFIYCHALFGRDGELGSNCVASTDDALDELVQQMNNYIGRKGFPDQHRLIDPGALKTNYCMAMVPDHAVLIDAEGRVCCCDAMPESMYFGDVHTGIDPAALERVSAPCEPHPECLECLYLPECTEFDRCPSRMPFDACRRQRARIMRESVQRLYSNYEHMKAKQQAEEAEKSAAAETEEAHVSD